MKKKIILSATIILIAALLAGNIILIADRINREVTLKKQFAGRISEAVYSLSEYEKYGEESIYRNTFMSLESASAIALTLNDDDYHDAAGMLSAIASYYAADPAALELFHGDLKEILEDFSSHRNIDNLYINLVMLNNRISSFSIYSRDNNIMLILSPDSINTEEVKALYDAGGLIIVFDADTAYAVRNIVKGAVTGTFSDELQAAIFYKVGGTGGTYELAGNSSNLVYDIEDAIKDIDERREMHGGIE